MKVMMLQIGLLTTIGRLSQDELRNCGVIGSAGTLFSFIFPLHAVISQLARRMLASGSTEAKGSDHKPG